MLALADTAVRDSVPDRREPPNPISAWRALPRSSSGQVPSTQNPRGPPGSEEMGGHSSCLSRGLPCPQPPVLLLTGPRCPRALGENTSKCRGGKSRHVPWARPAQTWGWGMGGLPPTRRSRTHHAARSYPNPNVYSPSAAPRPPGTSYRFAARVPAAVRVVPSLPDAGNEDGERTAQTTAQTRRAAPGPRSGRPVCAEGAAPRPPLGGVRSSHESRTAVCCPPGAGASGRPMARPKAHGLTQTKPSPGWQLRPAAPGRPGRGAQPVGVMQAVLLDALDPTRGSVLREGDGEVGVTHPTVHTPQPARRGAAPCWEQGRKARACRVRPGCERQQEGPCASPRHRKRRFSFPTEGEVKGF